jgi:hypothetical protein
MSGVKPDDEDAQAFFEEIQSRMPFGDPVREDLPDRALLASYVIVAEWEGSDGARWISRIHCGADGRDLTPWRVEGLLHHALHWGPEDDGDSS